MSNSQTPVQRPSSSGKRTAANSQSERPVTEEFKLPDAAELHNIKRYFYQEFEKEVKSLDCYMWTGKDMMQAKAREVKRVEGSLLSRIPAMAPEWEEQANQRFEACQSVSHLSSRESDHYLSAAKASMLYAGCSPRDIVGVRTRLVFDCTWASDYDRPFRAWPYQLSQSITRLIPHPAWWSGQPGGRASLLALALQYAVILRTGDTRPWELSVKDDFAQSIQRIVDSGKPAWDAHAKARADSLEKGAIMSMYHISNIFQALEGIVERTTCHIEPYPFYRVTSEDAKSLIGALDDMKDPETGNRPFSTDFFYKMAIALRPNQTIPSKRELTEFNEKVMLEESRRLIHHENSANGMPTSIQSLHGTSRDSADDVGEEPTR